jgi:carboxymethylenebutenolidase
VTHDVASERQHGANGIPVLLTQPSRPGPFPSVIILHERYGLVQHTEDLAHRLAAEGFVVAAPDLFFNHPDQERLHRGEVTAKPSDAEVLANLEAVVPLFAAHPEADESRLGIIGVCQTGRYPFVYGAAHPLQACVALYGAAQDRDWVVNDAQPHGLEGLIANMRAPALGIFGEKDHVISFADVQRLRDALERHNRSYDIMIYGDAPHGWLNDTMPGRYRPEIAARAWSKIVEFLGDTLSAAGGDGLVRWRFDAVKHADYDFTKNVRLE